MIGLGASDVRNAAPESDLLALANQLAGVFPQRDVILNGYGEALGPATGKSFPKSVIRTWTPTAVANFVKAGNIWIDYCGWPMWYTDTSSGPSVAAAGQGFQTFVKAAGFPTLTNADFNVALLTTYDIFGRTYPFSRGLKLQGATAGMFLNTRSFTVGAQANATIDYLTASGYCANFALWPSPPHGGIYVYATFVKEGLFKGLLGAANRVPVVMIAGFLKDIVAGHVNGSTGIEYTPYHQIGQLYHPPAPKKTVQTYNSQGYLACGPGTHMDPAAKSCVIDTPTQPAKSSGSGTGSGGGSGKSTTVPLPVSSPAWYDRPNVRTGIIIGGLALGGMGVAVGTRQLLLAQERRGS